MSDLSAKWFDCQSSAVDQIGLFYDRFGELQNKVAFTFKSGATFMYDLINDKTKTVVNDVNDGTLPKSVGRFMNMVKAEDNGVYIEPSEFPVYSPAPPVVITRDSFHPSFSLLRQ